MRATSFYRAAIGYRGFICGSDTLPAYPVVDSSWVTEITGHLRSGYSYQAA